MELTTVASGTGESAATFSDPPHPPIVTTIFDLARISRQEGGRVQLLQGRWAEAAASYQASVTVLDHLDDRRALGDALHDQGFAALAQGHVDEARACLERCLAVISREPGSRVDDGKSLALLGLALFLSGDRDGAEQRWLEAEKALADASDPEADRVRLWVTQWTGSGLTDHRGGG